MKRALSFIVIFGCFGFSTIFQGHADPMPILFGKDQAVAPPRQDPGNGLCVNGVHYRLSQENNPVPSITTLQQATTLLDNKVGGVVSFPSNGNKDLIVTTTEREKFLHSQRINFGDDNASKGQFFDPTVTAQNHDSSFPFCTIMAQSPQCVSFAIRLRGYLNVKEATTKPITFLLNGNDQAALYIGKQKTSVIQVDSRRNGAVSKQVQFTDPGLYPIELVYFQNGSAAYLEWSQTDISYVEGPITTDQKFQDGKFQLIAPDQFYSSIEKSTLKSVNKSECNECENDSDCNMGQGQFCANGLCQACDSNNRCGASCMKCAEDKPICSFGQSCEACIDDNQCGSGFKCDSGKCMTLPPEPEEDKGGCNSVPTHQKGLGTLFVTGVVLLLGFFLAHKKSQKSI